MIKFSKTEVQHLVIAILVAAFAFGFDDKKPAFAIASWLANYIRIVVIVAFIMVVKVAMHKLVAARYDSAVEHRLWTVKRYGLSPSTRLPVNLFGFTIHSLQLGILLPIVLAFLTLGKLPFVATSTFIISTNLIHRLGKRYIRLTEFEEAKIAAAGIYAVVVIAFIFKFLSAANPAVLEVVKIASLLAVFNMLPIPHLDGGRMFFGGKTFYIFNFVFILGSAFLLNNFGIIASIVVAIIFAIIVTINYQYFLYKSS